MYAIVRSGGRQHKVAIGEEFDTNRLTGALGDTVALPAVLVVDGENVTSDAATLAKVTVNAEVIAHAKGPKIDMMLYKNKSGYKSRLGHRQSLTRLRITGIETGK